VDIIKKIGQSRGISGKIVRRGVMLHNMEKSGASWYEIETQSNRFTVSDVEKAKKQVHKKYPPQEPKKINKGDFSPRGKGYRLFDK
jgi:flagellar basal body rod protein FlgC